MTQAAEHNILSDLLAQLQVRHTCSYCADRLESMPFKSLFGLTKVLQDYGIDSLGVKLTDKSEFSKLEAPFLAKMPDGLVIVTGQTADSVSYLTQGTPEQMPKADFIDAWSGTALLVFPEAKACEPQFGQHRTLEIGRRLMRIGLVAGVTALFLWLFVTNDIWRQWSTVLLTLLNIAGLYFTFLLVQKSLKIHNPMADSVCKVLEEGGCDSILETKASKFFGLFGWSEVGFSYFSVSLLCLLIFPQFTPYLAACNVICLPFTFWSIWYQRFRAHKWCTLCVSVQATLWLLFFCYLGGGWLAHVFPLRQQFFVLGVTYITALLALNRLMPFFDRSDK